MPNSFEAPHEDPAQFIEQYRELPGSSPKHGDRVGFFEMMEGPEVFLGFIEDGRPRDVSEQEWVEAINHWRNGEVSDEEFSKIKSWFARYIERTGKPLHNSTDGQFLRYKKAA